MDLVLKQQKDKIKKFAKTNNYDTGVIYGWLQKFKENNIPVYSYFRRIVLLKKRYARGLKYKKYKIIYGKNAKIYHDAAIEKAKQTSSFTIQFWVKKGLTVEEAKIKLFKNSSDGSKKWASVDKNSEKKKNAYGKLAEYQKKYGPFNKDFWIKKYGKIEGNIKYEQFRKNSKNAAIKSCKIKKKTGFYKKISTKNIEYWIKKGFSEEDAIRKLSESQSTFSLKKCIEKHGDEKGKEIWKNRQEKWQQKLKSKSKEELLLINSKKGKNSNGVYTLGYIDKFPEKIKKPSYFYILIFNIGNEKIIKLGLTTKNIYKRWKFSKYNIDVIFTKKMTLKDAILLEIKCLVANKQYKKYYPSFPSIETFDYNYFTEIKNNCYLIIKEHNFDAIQ